MTYLSRAIPLRQRILALHPLVMRALNSPVRPAQAPVVGWAPWLSSPDRIDQPQPLANRSTL